MKTPSIDTIDSYLEKPYWVIDLLPKQVPLHSPGQYFKIEQYYLSATQRDILCTKFTNIVLKLNCYYDIEVLHPTNGWERNPNPQILAGWIAECVSRAQIIHFLFETADALLTLSGDDTYMTLYQPPTELLDLVSTLALAEGLFVWQPPRQ